MHVDQAGEALGREELAGPGRPDAGRAAEHELGVRLEEAFRGLDEGLVGFHAGGAAKEDRNVERSRGMTRLELLDRADIEVGPAFVFEQALGLGGVQVLVGHSDASFSSGPTMGPTII